MSSSLRSLPPRAQGYVLVVSVAGAGILAWRLAALLGLLPGQTEFYPFQIDKVFLILVLFAAALGSRTVALGQKAEMALSLPLILCALLRVGPAGAIDVAVVGMLSTCLLRRRPISPHRTVFNVASIALVTFASGSVYAVLHAPIQADVRQTFAPAGYFLPLLLSVTTYFLSNTCIVALAISLSNRRSFGRIWKDSFRWTFISYLAGASIAVGMVHLLQAFPSPYSLVLAIPPILLIYYFYRIYIDRAAERRQRMEEIERHNAQLESEVARRTQDLIRLNERLTESNAELQRANRLKSEFLANMSHELRTPLNAIIGFSELLEERTFGELTPDQLNFVRDIHAGGKHLLNLINDILDLSKIEAGRMSLHREDSDLPAILRETLTVIRPLTHKKSLRLQIRTDPSAAVVSVDPGKVKQVMYNLLSNAVKFTGEGGAIDVEAWADGRDLVVSVKDTGIGIAAADMSRIFDEFYQVDGSLTRKHEGTGLGLALVKRLVEMHDGRVEVESRVGEGSVFRFRLPGAICLPEEEASAPNGDETAERSTGSEREGRGVVMVVEDNPTNMRLTRHILSSHGYGVLEAPSGEEALRLIRAQRPDLILMDLQLPGLDGLTLTRMIQNDPATCGIPTIALTACAMSGDEARAREAGCVGYIAKPVSAASLSRQVEAFLSAKSA